MRTPVRPVPHRVVRWMYLVRGLRWLDALVAWVVLWRLVVHAPEPVSMDVTIVPSLVLLALLAAFRPLRERWRPVSAIAAFASSRSLRPGDRAWHVGPRHAERVLVIGRRALRVTIELGGRTLAEGLSLRRTRAFLLPADDARAPRRS